MMRLLFTRTKVYYAIVFLVTLLLGGCSDVFNNSGGEIQSNPRYNIAILLPLSGKYAHSGDHLLHSAMLASSNNPNDYINYKIYDTQGDPDVAAKVALRAINQDHVKAIIGPLLSQEAEVIAKLANAKNIPVFTLSNNIHTILKHDNLYTLAYSPNINTEAIIYYGMLTGSKKMAIMYPDNNYGQSLSHTIQEVAKKNNIEITHNISYPPNKPMLKNEVVQLISSKQLKQYQYLMHKLEQEKFLLDKNGNKIYNPPKPKLDFDTLVIADINSRVNILSYHLASYDIDYKKLKILGSLGWNNPSLLNNKILNNSYFPAPTQITNERFVDNLKQYSNINANLLDYSLYDTILLVSSLVYQDESGYLVANFAPTNIIGNIKKGITGNFIIFNDHIARRNVSIQQIKNRSAVKAENMIEYSQFASIADYRYIFSNTPEEDIHSNANTQTENLEQEN